MRTLPRLYHLSFRRDLPSTIDPRRPDGIQDDNPLYEEEVFPEPDIPRFSCSPTIIQCFQAIYANVKHFFNERHYPHLDFYVYTPEITEETEVLTPDDLTKRRMVHDAFMTGEHCILNKFKLIKIAKVRIKRISNVEKIYYNPFNDPKETEPSWLPGGFSYEKLLSFKSISLESAENTSVFERWWKSP